MNTKELHERLIAEGCRHFSVSPFQHDGRFFAEYAGIEVIEKISGVWKIFFSERGGMSPPVTEYSSEEEACDAYYKIITSREHSHGICSYENEELAVKLQEELTSKGIQSSRKRHLPARKDGPHTHVVFVVGKDIFKVKELYRVLPLTDYDRDEEKNSDKKSE